MVNPTATSLLAEYANADDFEIGTDVNRGFSLRREQTSKTRFATAARYSRKRNAGSTAPLGPRRRLRK